MDVEEINYKKGESYSYDSTEKHCSMYYFIHCDMRNLWNLLVYLPVK